MEEEAKRGDLNLADYSSVAAPILPSRRMRIAPHPRNFLTTIEDESNSNKTQYSSGKDSGPRASRLLPESPGRTYRLGSWSKEVCMKKSA